MKHTLAEIKATNQKVAARHLVQINRLLDDVNAATDSEWRKIKIGCYLTILDIVHVDGRRGSLVYKCASAALRPLLSSLEMQNERAIECAALDDYYTSLPSEAGVW